MTKGTGNSWGADPPPKAEKGATIYVVQSKHEEFGDEYFSTLIDAERAWVEKGGSARAEVKKEKLK